MKNEELLNLVEKLDFESANLSTSLELLGLMCEETDAPEPDNAYKIHAYERLRILSNVLLNRLYDEKNKIQKIVEKLYARSPLS